MDSRRISRKVVPLALVPLLGICGIVVLARRDALPGAEPSAPAAPRTAGPDQVTLDDGQRLEGEVLTEGEDHVTVRLPDGTVRLVARERVKDLERGPVTAGTPVRVRLRSGRSVEGELVRRSAQSVELRLQPAGTLVTLRGSDVIQVEERTP